MKRFTTSDDATLQYQIDDSTGEGTNAFRSPIVFLNGMTQTIRHWSRQAKAFESDTPVIRYNARGQGESSLGDDEVSLERHTRDLIELLDEIDVDRGHLVGFSHGARIACHTAAKHPDCVSDLVLCSATSRENALARTTVRAWREALDAGGLEAMSWASLPTILGNDFLEESEDMIDGIVRASIRRNSEEGVRALLEALESYPPLETFAEDVEASTMVISGDEDMLVTPAGAGLLTELTGGIHQKMADVGHTIPIEAPERFARILREFLE